MKACGREIQTQRRSQVGDTVKYQHMKHTDAYEVTQTSYSKCFLQNQILKNPQCRFSFRKHYTLENSRLEIAPAVPAPEACGCSESVPHAGTLCKLSAEPSSSC